MVCLVNSIMQNYPKALTTRVINLLFTLKIVISTMKVSLLLLGQHLSKT